MDKTDVPVVSETAARVFLGMGLTQQFNLDELKRALGISLKQYGNHCDSPGRATPEILQQYTDAFYESYRLLKPFAEPTVVADEGFVQGFPFLDKEEMARDPAPERPLEDFLRKF